MSERIVGDSHPREQHLSTSDALTEQDLFRERVMETYGSLKSGKQPPSELSQDLIEEFRAEFKRRYRQLMETAARVEGGPEVFRRMLLVPAFTNAASLPGVSKEELPEVNRIINFLRENLQTIEEGNIIWGIEEGGYTINPHLKVLQHVVEFLTNPTEYYQERKQVIDWYLRRVRENLEKEGKGAAGGYSVVLPAMRVLQVLSEWIDPEEKETSIIMSELAEVLAGLDEKGIKAFIDELGKWRENSSGNSLGDQKFLLAWLFRDWELVIRKS